MQNNAPFMNFNIHEQNTGKLYKKNFFCYLTKKGGGQKFGRKFLIKKILQYNVPKIL